MVTALCDTTDVSNVLGGVTVTGALADSLIAAASDRVADYLDHDPNARTGVVATLSPTTTRSRLISLPEKNLTAVASVVENDAALVEGNDQDFVFYQNGRLERIGTRWYSVRPLGIVVTYSAGYAAIPLPIVAATAELVARQWAAGVAYAAIDAVGAVGFESEAMPDGYRYKVPAGANLDGMLHKAGMLSDADRSMLSVYRRLW